MNKTKCSNCGYEWKTNSTMRFVSCPSCLSKTKTKNEASKAKTLKAHTVQSDEVKR